MPPAGVEDGQVRFNAAVAGERRARMPPAGVEDGQVRFNAAVASERRARTPPAGAGAGWRAEAPAYFSGAIFSGAIRPKTRRPPPVLVSLATSAEPSNSASTSSQPEHRPFLPLVALF